MWSDLFQWLGRKPRAVPLAQRDALVRLIHDDPTTPPSQIPMKTVHAAARIIAAGWRPPD